MSIEAVEIVILGRPYKVSCPLGQQDALRQAAERRRVEAELQLREAEKSRSKQTKTWHFKAENVRDFAFATSRKFIWDAMGVPQDGTKDGSRCVNAVRKILAELEFPVLSSLGFVEGDIDELAEIALKDFFITQAPKPWSKQEVVDAFMSALKLESRVA